eukprot:752175_1
MEKRKKIYSLTGGKSSRFKPNTYKINIWTDKNNSDVDDVYKVNTNKILTAKCFYPSKKSTKSSKKSSKKKKRTRNQMENAVGRRDDDYNIDSDDTKPVRKRTRKNTNSKRKNKPKTKRGKNNSNNKLDIKSLGDDILSDFGTRMTRSRKKNLSKKK